MTRITLSNLDTPLPKESTDSQGKWWIRLGAGGSIFISGTAIGCLPRIDERGKHLNPRGWSINGELVVNCGNIQ